MYILKLFLSSILANKHKGQILKPTGLLLYFKPSPICDMIRKMFKANNSWMNAQCTQQTPNRSKRFSVELMSGKKFLPKSSNKKTPFYWTQLLFFYMFSCTIVYFCQLVSLTREKRERVPPEGGKQRWPSLYSRVSSFRGAKNLFQDGPISNKAGNCFV